MTGKAAKGEATSSALTSIAGHGHEADFVAVRARLHETATLPPEADLSNVVPFARSNDNEPAPSIELPADVAEAHRAAFADGSAHRAGFIALSLVIHSGLASLLWH